MLEGPDQVGEATQQLISEFRLLTETVRDYGEAHARSADDLQVQQTAIDEIGQHYLAARREFIAAARSALDEIIDIR